jgi:hypothetical protein
MSLAEPDNFI